MRTCFFGCCSYLNMIVESYLFLKIQYSFGYQFGTDYGHGQTSAWYGRGSNIKSISKFLIIVFGSERTYLHHAMG